MQTQSVRRKFRNNYGNLFRCSNTLGNDNVRSLPKGRTLHFNVSNDLRLAIRFLH